MLLDGTTGAQGNTAAAGQTEGNQAGTQGQAGDTTQQTQGQADTTQTGEQTQGRGQQGQTGDQGAQGGQDGQGEKTQTGAPEKYDFKLPEGMQADQTLLDEFSGLAKGMNLTQEQAQGMLDLYHKQVAGIQAKFVSDHEARIADWQKTVKADAEYGGAKLEQNLAVAKKALDKFGGQSLVDLLNSTGLGDHPEVIRYFYRVGSRLKEDGFVEGSKVQEKSAADVLFDAPKK
jgi:hypothetical protein